jgi:hypothetical protein
VSEIFEENDIVGGAAPFDMESPSTSSAGVIIEISMDQDMEYMPVSIF